MLDYFNIEDMSDIPHYTNNKFKGGKRLRQALLFLIQSAKKPVTATQLRVAFYRKYHECKNFEDLSITQVSLLLRNLIIQKSIKRVSRGLYTYNNSEPKGIIKSKTNDEAVDSMPFVYQLYNLFPKRHKLTRKEIRLLIKNKMPHIQISENSLSNAICHLRKRGKLIYKDGKYSVRLVKEKTFMEILHEKIDIPTLTKLLEEHETIVDIASYFHVSPISLRKFLAYENISRPLYKGTKLIDLNSGKIWYYIKDCLQDLNITSAKLTALLNGTDTLEGFNIKKYKDVKHSLLERKENG